MREEWNKERETEGERREKRRYGGEEDGGRRRWEERGVENNRIRRGKQMEKETENEKWLL